MINTVFDLNVAYNKLNTRVLFLLFQLLLLTVRYVACGAM